MGAPPKALDGDPLELAGRAVMPGVASYGFLLSPRAPADEVWASLWTLRSDVGFERLRQIHGNSVDVSAHARIVAYLHQGESFYRSALSLSADARPLPAYYAMLNLAKAFLTTADPGLTAKKIFHGASDAFEQRQRYWFSQERTKITSKGVLREVAVRTGALYCYPAGHVLQIQDLAAYLAETVDLCREAIGEHPKLVPLQELAVLYDGSSAWLRAEVSRSELKRRGSSPNGLLAKAFHFSDQFHLVQRQSEVATYESHPIAVEKRKVDISLSGLISQYEGALIHRDRTGIGDQFYVVLSDRTKLLSQEAVALLVMHHLSNAVRYRPEQVGKLARTKWWYLFSTWVPRAMENYLFAIASRLLKEEMSVNT